MNPILYQDHALFVINKPSGLPSAPVERGVRDDSSVSNDTLHSAETAVTLALKHCPELSLMPGPEHGLLHRLDTGTSGCLAFAKTPEAFEFYKTQWSLIQKEYTALATQSEAPLKSPVQITAKIPYLIEWPLGHAAKSKKRMIALTPDRASKRQWLTQIRGHARPTRSTILSLSKESLKTDEGSQSVWRFSIAIETGVLHQIRCTLATLGYPLLGDAIYGGSQHSRLCLHAARLVLPAFTAPAGSASVTTKSLPTFTLAACAGNAKKTSGTMIEIIAPPAF